MQHLLTTLTKVRRMQQSAQDGASSYAWSDVAVVKMRFDLVFQRPGRDDLGPAMEAGRAPDRAGLAFCMATTDIRVGDRLQILDGMLKDKQFEVMTQPDPVPGFSDIHHLEIPVREVAQSIAGPSLTGQSSGHA